MNVFFFGNSHASKRESIRELFKLKVRFNVSQYVNYLNLKYDFVSTGPYIPIYLHTYTS